MITYYLSAEKELYDKSTLFIEEIASGVFGVKKTVYELTPLLTPEAVIQLFNDTTKRVAIKANERIRTNFQLYEG